MASKESGFDADPDQIRHRTPSIKAQSSLKSGKNEASRGIEAAPVPRPEKFSISL